MQLQARGSLHSRHCQSKHIWPAATASASYGQLCAGCMISAHAESGTVQVAGGIKAAARCGRGRCPSNRWPEHVHWPWGCHHVFKAHVLCCNASSKWAVSGRDRQAQRSDHGSDCSLLAHTTSSSHPFPPLPISFLYSSSLSNLSVLCITSLCPSSDVAFVQGSFEGVESASHAGWMSHAPPSQVKKGVWCRGINARNKQGASIA